MSHFYFNRNWNVSWNFHFPMIHLFSYILKFSVILESIKKKMRDIHFWVSHGDMYDCIHPPSGERHTHILTLKNENNSEKYGFKVWNLHFFHCKTNGPQQSPMSSTVFRRMKYSKPKNE